MLHFAGAQTEAPALCPHSGHAQAAEEHLTDALRKEHFKQR